MMLSLITLLACGPKKPATTQEPPPASRTHTKRPQPLVKKTFAVPNLDESKLSNGLPVFVQQNMEVPLVRVWLTFDAGGWIT